MQSGSAECDTRAKRAASFHRNQKLA